MNLLTLDDIHLAFGERHLLDGVNLSIAKDERVALVGRNGTGKSSLLRIIAGHTTADAGRVITAAGVRVGYMTQEVPEDRDATVFQAVAEGLGALGATLSEFHRLSADASADELERLQALQDEIEAADGWQFDQQVEATLSRLGLDGNQAFSSLSGGWRRRVWLARALVGSPDLLLLDEPTNHLDVDSIEWLEQALSGWPGTLVFVTHDRRFLDHIATRIIDLDRGKLTNWPGSFALYRERKTAQLEAEAAQAREFDRRLAQEERWIRQGIKARRTRNEGRVRALESMRKERRQRRELLGSASMQAVVPEQSGKVVVDARHVSYGFTAEPVIRDFSTTILRGDKIGVLGPNGAGKTTLLRLLLGELEPQQGSVRHGTRLEIAFFDQQREIIDDNATPLETVGEGSDHVTIGGRQRHAIGYLQDFLFTPTQARAPVKNLSGGERGRLLLARLFCRPANILVLDEPTNDLDLETLDLLEEQLADYSGTVLLVSHDRAFLDNVVTSTLAAEGNGRFQEYVGGYADWLRQRPPREAATSRDKPRETRSPPAARPKKPRKAGNRVKHELSKVMQDIQALETQQAALQTRLADPDFYRGADEAPAEAQIQLSRVESRLERAYQNWAALEDETTE